MSARGRKLAYIADVERRSGFAPLTFIMARYLDAYNVRGLDDLKHVLNTKEMNGVGIGTLNEIRKVAGIPVVGKSLTNKKAAQAWERCADSLVDYAREFLQQLAWGKGYSKYDSEIKQAEDAIKEYERLKNEKN
jgi:hypothetical protein